MNFGNAILRAGLTAAYQIYKLRWAFSQPRTFGAHAFALTPERRLILVKLRYVSGWRLPGGGRRKDEDAIAAALRELREEVGATAHGAVRLAAELEQRPDRRRDLVSVVIVEDVLYAPRWSWEVERVIEVPLDNLPGNLAPIARGWIEAVRDKV